MTICPVSEEIKNHVNEENSASAQDILNELLENDIAYINGESYDFSEITDMFDKESMCETMYNSAIKQSSEDVTALYIKKIEELM